MEIIVLCFVRVRVDLELIGFETSHNQFKASVINHSSIPYMQVIKLKTKTRKLFYSQHDFVIRLLFSRHSFLL